MLLLVRKGKKLKHCVRDLAKLLRRDNVEVSVQEVKNPELDAAIVAKSIAEQLEKRASFKKVMKKAATSSYESWSKRY